MAMVGALPAAALSPSRVSSTSDCFTAVPSASSNCEHQRAVKLAAIRNVPAGERYVRRGRDLHRYLGRTAYLHAAEGTIGAGSDYLILSGRDDGILFNVGGDIVFAVRGFEAVAGDLDGHAPLGDPGIVLALALGYVFGEGTAHKAGGDQTQDQQKCCDFWQLVSFHYCGLPL